MKETIKYILFITSILLQGCVSYSTLQTADVANLNNLLPNIDAQTELGSTLITGLKTSITNYNTSVTCFINSTGSGGLRVSATNCDDPNIKGQEFNTALNDASIENKKIVQRNDIFELLEMYYTITTYLGLCYDETMPWGFEPYEGGIIPQCFWRSQNISKSDKYTSNDLSIYAGVIDDLYSQTIGLSTLGQTLKKLSSTFLVTILNILELNCTQADLQVLHSKFTEYRIDATVEENTWISSWIAYNQWETVVDQIDDCARSEIVIDGLKTFYQFVIDAPQVKSKIDEIVKLSTKYFKEVFLNDNATNIERYKQAKALTEVITFFTPFVVAKISKVSLLAKLDDVIAVAKNSKEKFVEVLKKALRWKLNGAGSVIYKSDFATHLTDVVGFTQQRGVIGGHNLSNFENYLTANAIEINRLSSANGSIDGLVELSYQIKKADGSGGWKATIFKKTIYDPTKITDGQVIQFGKEAMQEGITSSRTVLQTGSNTIIKGEASNGMKFLGYQNPATGEVLNFHPVINW
jgi:predicted small secreted protein